MDVANIGEIKKQVAQDVSPAPEESAELKNKADENAKEIMATDIESFEQRQSIIKAIDEFGLSTMQQSAQKNALLKVPVGNLSKAGDEGGQVSKSLVDLHREIKDLDPSLIDFAKTGVLGKLFNPIRSYFMRYKKADVVITEIISSLDRGRTTLLHDNTTLELEEQSLRDVTKKLYKEIDLAQAMDQSIDAQIEKAKLENVDAAKIKFVTEEILFPLRQRLMDMQQMVVVNQQGIMAIEVIIRNNKELVRGVDRAKNVTISALRIAVMVASALYNQKIVLQKIEALNETTNNIISGTSHMLKEQGTEIQKQSMEANVSVETLKASFIEVLSAMDEISNYKQQALPKMKETVSQFRQLADEGEVQIKKIEEAKQLKA